MVVLARSSSNMYECRVLYIGSAPPIETLKGIEALQEPLRQRYPSNMDQAEGIDANIRVLPNALEVTYLASGQVVHFPLDRLQICAGVRAVTVVNGTTGEATRQFVPVNNLQQESKHPAIFGAIIRRNKGRQIAECHAFICNSTRDALHLVNATATANMALKRGRQMQYNTDSNDSGVAVVHTAVVNGNETVNGNYNNHERRTYSRNNEVYVGANVNTTLESQHFQIETPRVEAQEPETIYITFDKSNLKPTGEDTLEVTPRYVERRTFAPPSPRPMYAQQRYTVVQAPPPPQPMMYTRPLPPPPPPVFVRPPPPPMFVRPPPPRPMYTRRVISPPPMRYAAPAPVYVRSRARSASPIRYTRSEIRQSSKGQYQPKWSGKGKPASDSGFRASRREQFDRYGPPRQNVFLNEQAFSRRMNADYRIAQGPATGYQYPTAYDLHDALYDRPTTKSNPRYSSSSDSDDGKDNRFTRRSTRRSTRNQ